MSTQRHFSDSRKNKESGASAPDFAVFYLPVSSESICFFSAATIGGMIAIWSTIPGIAVMKAPLRNAENEKALFPTAAINV